MKYEIDIVSESEYPFVLGIWESSVRATHTFLTEEDIDYYRPRILNSHLKNLQLSCIRKGSSHIIGFMGVAGNSLEMLFIHPDHLGKGHGKMLLMHAIYQMGIHRVDVNEDNKNALRFYQKNGFQIRGRSDGDGSGKAHPLLHLELKSSRIIVLLRFFKRIKRWLTVH